MIVFALYLLKMSLCSGVLYAYYHLALRNRIFHQYNRFYLLAAVLFSLLFPLVPLPHFYQNAQPADAIQIYRLLLFSSGESMVAAGATQSWNWQAVVVFFYAAICLTLLGRLIAGMLQIRSLMMQSEVQHSEHIHFVSTDHAAAPFSFFNWLFWKREIELDSEGGRAIFRHELVHIQEKHTVDKLLMQAVLVIFWINPFFWLMRRELQIIHEFIADKKAIGQQGAAALATMILQAAYCKKHYQFINAFFQQPIKRRLTMLQKTLGKPQNAYLSRVLSLPLCALLLLAFAKKEEPIVKTVDPIAANTTAVFTLTDTIPTENIKEVRVNKTDTVNTITIIYKDGKEETLTEKQAREKGLLTPPPPPPPPPAPMPNLALLVIDGKEQGPVGNGKKLNAINPSDIESMNVLKNEHATKKYGEKGKNGVIEIITKPKGQNKKAASEATSMVPRQGANIVHTEVEQSPSFPGGKAAWQTFLEKNLNASIAVENSAPPGNYQVQVQFKVANDGTISDIQPATALGYGMEQEVIALMQKSPKWMPAEQNGYKVTALHKQKVTFVVAEE